MRRTTLGVVLYVLALSARADNVGKDRAVPDKVQPSPEEFLRLLGRPVNNALAELNGIRAQRGLPPFIEDPLLTQGAQNAANYRAERLMEGHTPNDFQHLPPGGHARAAGCAAWPVSMGFGSCCMYDTQYRYAGAASTMGRDGRRYCHLFVR